MSGTFTTTFTYNGDGDRVAQAENDMATSYVVTILGLSQVLVQTTGGEATYYVYGHDLLAQEEGTWAYHLNDGLGSVRQLADEDGTIILAQSYTPFGEPLRSAGSRTTTYGFTGEQWGAYTGLLFLRARYYEPTTGRFLNEDQWVGDRENPGSLHRYAYSGNNPIQYVDPSGFQATDPTDPFDPGWCHDWSFPRKIVCQIITGKRTPNWLRYTYMYSVYTEIVAGMAVAGPLTGGNYSFERATEFWTHFLLGSSRLGHGDYVELKGDEWGEWARTHEFHQPMHDQQLEDFFREQVWPAAQRCETCVGPWRAGRDRYKFVEAGHANNDVTVAIGRHYIEGDFYAKNIQTRGSLVSADVTIERFIDDRFDFKDDTGSIPVHNILGDMNILGYGHVPNVWAQRLMDENWAHEFDIHIEWVEKFAHEWKP